MAYNKTEKSDSPMKRRGGIRRRKKVCVFCGKDNVIDYKDTNKLKRYISERGKILPRRITDSSRAGVRYNVKNFRNVICILCLTLSFDSPFLMLLLR